MNGIFIRVLFLCSFLAVVFNTGAQGKKRNLQVSGVIKDNSTNEPLIGANVYVSELRHGAVTDLNGTYMLKMPVGVYHFEISYVGYKTVRRTLDVTDGAVMNVSLSPNIKLDEVVVTSAKKDDNVTRVDMGVEKLSVKEIQKMPPLMGEVDVIKVIQLLPGVQSTSEGSSGYNVRGSAADQNLVLLDNTNIYNPAHLLGFFSVFNNDVVKSVDFYKGNLPVRYGGRLSSLLNVKTKDEYPDKIKGSGGIGLISSRLVLEGPLGKKTSWVIGGRRSYADVFLKLSSDPEKRSSYIYFYDLNGKLSHKFSKKDKLSVNFYHGTDKFKSAFGVLGYGNTLISSKWNHIYSDDMYSELSFHYTNYNYKIESKVENSKLEWMSAIDDFTIDWCMTKAASDVLRMEYGVSSTFHRFDPALVTRKGYPDFKMQKSYVLDHSVYLGFEQDISSRLGLKYGLRTTAFQNIGSADVYSYDDNYDVSGVTHYGKGTVYHTYIRVEPRFGAVYKFDKKTSVKANYAHNVQFIQMANNSDSGSPLDLWFPASKNIKPQAVDMYSAGYFRNFKNNAIETSVELYYKHMTNVIDFVDNAQLLLNDEMEGEVRTGKGQSYGMEFMVKKNKGRLTGFVNYTLSRTERTIPGINDGKTYLAPYDKTHCVNILLSYKASEKFSFSAGWVFSTGAPATYPTGRFEVNGEYFPIYAERNNSRKENYHRLDLSATYTPSSGRNRRKKGEWVLSLYNAYWHKNPWMISFSQNTSEGYPKAEMTYLFGMVPSITYNFKF